VGVVVISPSIFLNMTAVYSVCGIAGYHGKWWN